MKLAADRIEIRRVIIRDTPAERLQRHGVPSRCAWIRDPDRSVVQPYRSADGKAAGVHPQPRAGIQRHAPCERSRLDGHYTAFGRVVDGMGVVDAIEATPRDGETPRMRIDLKSVRLEKGR
jgi:hypothetical protein